MSRTKRKHKGFWMNEVVVRTVLSWSDSAYRREIAAGRQDAGVSSLGMCGTSQLMMRKQSDKTLRVEISAAKGIWAQVDLFS